MSLLTEKREAAGLSMTECAKRAGMDLSKLSRLEHGHLRLKVDDLRILAKVIGCKPGDLIPDDEHLDDSDTEPPAIATNKAIALLDHGIQPLVAPIPAEVSHE